MNANKLRQLAQNKLFLILVIIPLFITVIYISFIAQERYISTSQITVKRPQDATTSALNIGLLMGSSNNSSTEDMLYLKNYIRSQEMLKTVDKELDLHTAYGQAGLDFFNKLPEVISKEGFLRYFQNKISVSYDDKIGVLNIETQGFTPVFALELNKAILKESERFVNELSHDIVHEQMDFAEQEVTQGISTVCFNQRNWVNNIAQGFTHFCAVYDHPAMAKYLFRNWQFKAHEHHRPNNGVETNDFLTH